MTDAEWREGTKSFELLAHVQKVGRSDRKYRLFACACIRQVAFQFRYPQGENKFLVALECFADDPVPGLQEVTGWTIPRWWYHLAVPNPQEAAMNAISEALRMYSGALGGDALWAKERDYLLDLQSGLVRDIFGNTFKPFTAELEWLTSTVMGLAHLIYDDRAFDRLPILADALEEAGCTDAAILEHCRQPGEHVRGCWVVDLILGKA